MDIKKTGFLNKIFKLDKKKPTPQTGPMNKKDSLNLSEEAKIMSEVNKYKEMIKKMPDIREDKVNTIKQNLKNESYMSKEVYESVADKLSKFLED
jgi:negative regulator of flagellin synthesis FlgM